MARSLSGKIRFRIVEHRAGSKEQNTNLAGQRSGLGKTTVISRIHLPREIGGRFVAKSRNEGDRLFDRSSRIISLVSGLDHLINNRQTTEVAEHVGIVNGYDHLHFGLAPFFECFVHIRNRIDVLNDDPRGTYTLPTMLLRKRIFRVCHPLLISRVVLTVIVMHVRLMVPAQSRHSEVGNTLQNVPTEFRSPRPGLIGQSERKRKIGLRNSPLGIHTRCEYRILVHATIGCLIQKVGSEFQIRTTGQHYRSDNQAEG